MTRARVSSSRSVTCASVGPRPLALERVADERAPVVGAGIAREPALDLAQVGRQVVGEVDLGRVRRGEEDVVERRPDAEEQHRLARLDLAHRVDEERDRLELVRLDLAVVVGQVLAGNPVVLEARVAAIEDGARGRPRPYS